MTIHLDEEGNFRIITSDDENNTNTVNTPSDPAYRLTLPNKEGRYILDSSTSEFRESENTNKEAFLNNENDYLQKQTSINKALPCYCNNLENKNFFRRYLTFNKMLFFTSGIISGIVSLEMLKQLLVCYEINITDLFWKKWISINISNNDETAHQIAMEAIEERYSQSINKLQQFATDIDNEIAALEKYVARHESSYTRYIFSSNQSNLQQVKLDIQNLYYLKALVVN